MDEYMGGWMDEWIGQKVNKRWINEQMNIKMDEWMNE